MCLVMQGIIQVLLSYDLSQCGPPEGVVVVEAVLDERQLMV